MGLSVADPEDGRGDSDRLLRAGIDPGKGDPRGLDDSGFSVASNGALTPVPGSPFATG